ncbi:MAG: ABC transporter permease subunit, partial [Ktedonobacterales bacterium]
MLSLALRSIWSKTLRDYRIPILAWGIGMALLLVAQITTIQSLINTPAARESVAQLANSFRFFGEPVAIATPLGYATWKSMGVVPVLLGIWAVLAGASLIRGEEERGALDLLLAEPESRARILTEKIAALA